jgi:hypothetical protein
VANSRRQSNVWQIIKIQCNVWQIIKYPERSGEIFERRDVAKHVYFFPSAFTPRSLDYLHSFTTAKLKTVRSVYSAGRSLGWHGFRPARPVWPDNWSNGPITITSKAALFRTSQKKIVGNHQSNLPEYRRGVSNISSTMIWNSLVMGREDGKLAREIMRRIRKIELPFRLWW